MTLCAKTMLNTTLKSVKVLFELFFLTNFATQNLV